MQENTALEETVSPSPTFQALLIANPKAGSYFYHPHRVQEVLKRLRRHGWQAELRLTEGPGHARRLAGEAVAAGVDMVVAVGGDGTINEIIQELAGSQTALGVLPLGTVNVWAREVGIPFDHHRACEVLLTGDTRTIDLGTVNERYFLLMAGIGIDGMVAHVVEKQALKRLGVLGYLLAMAWHGLGYPSFKARLTINRRNIRTRAVQIMIGNTQLYGGTVKFTWHAQCDDGLLDLCVVRQRSPLGRIVVGLDFLLRRHQRRQWIHYETGESIKLYTSKPIPLQIDGDAAGYTPATFSVAPGALRVIVPQNAPASLFSKEIEPRKRP